MSKVHKNGVLNSGIILLYKYSIWVYYNCKLLKTSNKKGVIKLPYPNINAERVRNGMTMEDLAGKLGVTRKTVYNWMTHGNIPQSKLEAMAAMFKCSIDYLLKTSERNETKYHQSTT